MPGTKNNITATIFKRSAFLTGARLFQVAVTFVIFWLFALYLTKEAYGTYQKVFVMVSLFSGLFCLGMPVAIASLPPASALQQAINILKKARLIYLFIFTAGIVAVICFVNFILLQTRLLLLPLIFFNSIYLFLEAILIKLHKDRYVLINNIIYTTCYFILHYFALTRPLFSLDELVTWLLLLSAARLLLLFVNNRNTIHLNPAEMQTGAGNMYFAQWKLLSMNEVLDTFSRQVDKLFLLWLISAAAFAVYFNGSYEIPLVGILVSTAGTFITMHTVHEKSETAVKSILNESSILMACVLFPLFFFLFFNAGPLFRLLFNHNYQESVPVFLISCCIIPFRILNYTAVLQGFHKAKEIFAGSIAGLSSKLLLSIPLYFLLGVKGVALAYILGTALQMFYYLVQTAPVLKTGLGHLLPLKQLLLIFVLTGVAGSVCLFLPAHTTDKTILVISITILLFSMAAGLFLHLKKRKQAEIISP